MCGSRCESERSFFFSLQKSSADIMGAANIDLEAKEDVGIAMFINGGTNPNPNDDPNDNPNPVYDRRW